MPSDGQDTAFTRLYDLLGARHDPEAASVYMGRGSGQVNSIHPATAVIRYICENAEGILRGVACMLG